VFVHRTNVFTLDTNWFRPPPRVPTAGDDAVVAAVVVVGTQRVVRVRAPGGKVVDYDYDAGVLFFPEVISRFVEEQLLIHPDE
jgi:hypothetical protein